MATVTYLGTSYPCATAYKGADFVHLVDANGCMIAAFDGITEFDDFSITDGSWATLPADNDSYLAVIKDDGTIGKGGHRCCDMLAKSGGIITGNITSNSHATGFACTVGAYDIRMQANNNGNRGLYDNHVGKWLIIEDANNNVTLNGTAARASALASGAVIWRHCGSWTGEVAASGYTSTITIAPYGVSGYTFFGPVTFGSSSSYFCCYGLLIYNGNVQLYGRNIHTKAITPTVDIYGLYIKN